MKTAKLENLSEVEIEAIRQHIHYSIGLSDKLARVVEASMDIESDLAAEDYRRANQ